MARITIDDCLRIIPNRFDVTLAAAKRARQIAGGSTPMVEANDDKATVISLRELAAAKYGAEILSTNRTDPTKGQLDQAGNATAPNVAHEAQGDAGNQERSAANVFPRDLARGTDAADGQVTAAEAAL